MDPRGHLWANPPNLWAIQILMVLIDGSTRWTYVSLLSSHNFAFVKLLAQLILLRAQFPDYPIWLIRLDNVGEFTSKAFNDYCLATGIDVEHPVPHIHTQNDIAESLIKRLKLITRQLILNAKLPFTVWGHAILHTAALI